VSELRTLARQINQRILEANQLSRALQVSNTDLKRTQLELEHLLTTDPLTGCGNRKALDQRLQEEWHRARRSGEPLSCLCIALDGVDLASSEFGAEAGEALQKAAAVALRERLRITDHLFRPSHRQFVVIATGCNASDAQHLGRSLMTVIDGVWIRPQADGAVAGPTCHIWQRDDPELRALPRLGIASLDIHQDSAESLLERAEECLAATKPSSQGFTGSGLTSSDHAASAEELS
jgi:diguanylate cyclase (GGDEF)-like protein